MASDSCITAHKAAHCENNSAPAHPLPCAPFLPKHTQCLIKEVSFFMLPYCWCSFVTAGLAGFASRLLTVPEVLPLPDRLPLRIVHHLEEEVTFIYQPGHTQNICWMLLTHVSKQLVSSPRGQGEDASWCLPSSAAAGCVPCLPLCMHCGTRSIPVCLCLDGEDDHASSMMAPCLLSGMVKGLTSFPDGSDYLVV